MVEKIKFKHQGEPEYHLPKNNNIIDFEAMSLFAERRTGTSKLAVLKMDIDNLGSYFRKQQELENAQKLSKAFGWFFQTRLYDFLDVTIADTEDRYRENIYIIFSGGDDCFLVGAWDAAFEFALIIQREFQAFQEGLQKIMSNLSNKEITLSAGLLMIDEHFPVVRFAELAEEAIEKSKTYLKNGESKPAKNKIAVFGEVLSWKDFRKVEKIKNQLVTLLDNGESRGMLERIKMSSVGFNNLQEKARKGYIKANQVWRFQYYLRNVKHLDNLTIIDKMIQEYQAYLISAISGKQYTDIAIFPVAARWAEFATRKNLTNIPTTL